MKFFADEMLGKLARWLRMCGLDVAYQRQLSDSELVQRARVEGRVILTRDTRMHERVRPEEFVFISYNYLEEQFVEFRERFFEELKTAKPFTRCVECNSPLEAIEKSDVKEKVWPYVFETQENFTTCHNCHKIYWEATHVAKIKERLKELLNPS